MILKFLLYLMGIPSAVPFLETVAYAGYPFVLVCLSAFVGAAAGMQPDSCLPLHVIRCRSDILTAGLLLKMTL